MFPIDGDWVVLLHDGARCCPQGLSSSDMILVCTRLTQPGTLRSLLSATFGKNRPLQGATVYVARINRAGELRMARPCDSCLSVLTAAGARKIVYSTDEGKIASEWI